MISSFNPPLTVPVCYFVIWIAIDRCDPSDLTPDLASIDLPTPLSVIAQYRMSPRHRKVQGHASLPPFLCISPCHTAFSTKGCINRGGMYRCAGSIATFRHNMRTTESYLLNPKFFHIESRGISTHRRDMTTAGIWALSGTANCQRTEAACIRFVITNTMVQ